MGGEAVMVLHRARHCPTWYQVGFQEPQSHSFLHPGHLQSSQGSLDFRQTATKSNIGKQKYRSLHPKK